MHLQVERAKQEIRERLDPSILAFLEKRAAQKSSQYKASTQSSADSQVKGCVLELSTSSWLLPWTPKKGDLCNCRIYPLSCCNTPESFRLEIPAQPDRFLSRGHCSIVLRSMTAAPSLSCHPGRQEHQTRLQMQARRGRLLSSQS